MGLGAAAAASDSEEDTQVSAADRERLEGEVDDLREDVAERDERIESLQAELDDATTSSTRERLTTTTTAPTTTTTATTTTADPFANESVSQRNARRKASEYLDYTAFSRTGLIQQLEFEGFSTADATYGVDALDVDWFDQAAKKAAEYMDYSSFSRSGLIEQLKFEGFTQAEAEHGANSVGL